MIAKRLMAVVLIAAAAFALPSAASAALIGTTVSLAAYYPNASSQFESAGSAVVGNGLEFAPGSFNSYQETFDFTDTGLTVAYTGNGTVFTPSAFNGFKITFSSAVPTSYTVDATSTQLLTSSSLVGNVLSLNYSGQAVAAGSSTRVSFGFGSAVPEPMSWVLMILGFGAIGVAMRRRNVMTSISYA